ncbi:unnamed protein product [Prorocentrum cordatum]|uniref:PseI/NeuA/B-like domain-containing protein n=1 Tax=Prorocentrum cordatum TaxID=2364126 RepID=A0ABN9WIC7_9DINO|nr:unnamed protein product [Polarella glacialis]
MGEPAQKKARVADLSALHQFTYTEAKVIAEIGCNHRGEIETAKELLTLCKEAGATVGKFQKRCPKELLTPEQYNAPHPNPQNSFGSTYGEHREFLELSLDDHRELQNHCKSIGLEYSCSTWDLTSAKEIVQLNPCLIKVGSPSNMHWPMMEYLREHYTGEVHISTGMTTKDEIEQIVKFWEEGKGDAKNRVVLYNCTSGYPVPFKDVCLLDIRLLQEKYQHRVKHIGFSGHHLGIAIDVAAYAMGAVWIERHFTKDQSTDKTGTMCLPEVRTGFSDWRCTLALPTRLLRREGGARQGERGVGRLSDDPGHPLGPAGGFMPGAVFVALPMSSKGAFCAPRLGECWRGTAFFTAAARVRENVRASRIPVRDARS